MWLTHPLIGCTKPVKAYVCVGLKTAHFRDYGSPVVLLGLNISSNKFWAHLLLNNVFEWVVDVFHSNNVISNQLWCNDIMWLLLRTCHFVENFVCGSMMAICRFLDTGLDWKMDECIYKSESANWCMAKYCSAFLIGIRNYNHILKKLWIPNDSPQLIWS